MLDGSSHFLNRTSLVKFKFKAMRSGIWYKALSRLDRVLVDLTIRVTEKIRSASLAKSISIVIGKLEGLFENGIEKSVRLIGRRLAEKISTIAQRLGNSSARDWANDYSFALFLAVMHLQR